MFRLLGSKNIEKWIIATLEKTSISELYVPFNVYSIQMTRHS